MRQPDAIVLRGQPARSSSSRDSFVATLCRLLTYFAAVSPLLLIIVLAGVYPELNRTETSDWRSLVSLADEASKRGDRYEARRLYSQIDRVAYWQNDWQGLVTAACRINKLDGVRAAPSRSLSILFRAATVAERVKSREGLATVAKSLSLLGSDHAAALVVARVEPNWPNEMAAVDARYLLAGCAP